MRVVNYCHFICSDPNAPVISLCGNPDIDLLEQWSRWREMTDTRNGRCISFIDVPTSRSGVRVLVAALPGGNHGVIAFSVTQDDVPFNARYFATVYQSLSKMDGAQILSAISAHVPFDFSIEQAKFERPPLTPNLAELRGMQLIGNTEKSIHTISRMIPENVSVAQFNSILLAVNPMAYDKAFTTVISEDTPEGSWDKSRISNRLPPSVSAFHRRRHRAIVRRCVNPRLYLWFLVSAVLFIGLVSALVFGYRVKRAYIRQTQQLIRTTEHYDFFRQRARRQVEDLQFENATLRSTIRRMEAQEQEKRLH